MRLGAAAQGFGRRLGGIRKQLGEIADRIVSGFMHAPQLFLLLVRQFRLLAAQLALGARDRHALACRKPRGDHPPRGERRRALRPAGPAGRRPHRKRRRSTRWSHRRRPRAASRQSDQNDWRTPRKFLDAVRAVLVAIDLGLLAILEGCAGLFKPAECQNYFEACGYDPAELPALDTT